MDIRVDSVEHTVGLSPGKKSILHYKNDFGHKKINIMAMLMVHGA